jgi:phosphopantothenoylcysteine synthetase/decarboxylase
MNVLITAGNTQAPIDRVRCLTNIFTGRTGAAIAACAHARGHQVALLTSHPETITGMQPAPERWQMFVYRTFIDLEALLSVQITSGAYHAVIHAAAVSDYLAAGIFAPAPGTQFLEPDNAWSSAAGPPTLVNQAAAKVKSDAPELWLRLTRAPKLIDRIRTDWAFQGTLVKFKLEVGINDEQLVEVAERARRHSHADWMVANTLEGAADWAYLGPFADGYHKISRSELPTTLLEAIEKIAEREA